MSIRDPIITLEPSPWFFSLNRQSGSLQEIEASREDMNMLQVTVDNRAIVFDLAESSSIPAVLDFPGLQDFMDPESHVESPVVMTQAKREEAIFEMYGDRGEDTAINYLLKQEIIANCQGNLFLKRQTI